MAHHDRDNHTTPTPHEHKHKAPAHVRCVVVTCSDTRTRETDTSGPLAMSLLKEHGHEVIGYHLIKDDPAQICATIDQVTQDDLVEAIIINGGTGISRRDSTFEAVEGLLEKQLDGFGELFRYLTYMDIGSPAIMSRATAGVYRNRIIVSTPGSENAVRLAMEKLLLPELAHMIQQITKT